MTTEEFHQEFLISYNAIASNSNPGFDSFEISTYLTKAQLEIVKNYDDSLSNRKQKGFENTEKRRVDLKNLVKSFKSTSSFSTTDIIDDNSKFYNIPDDVFLKKSEHLKIISTDCNNGKVIEIKPITHDEFLKQKRNPFKVPNKNIVWRLDFSKINSKNVVEIISNYNSIYTLEYQLRYLKLPNPIIIENLETAFPGENLSLYGKTQKATSELDSSMHSEILDRAVELALRDYKPAGLESKIQLDIRNE